MEVSDAPIHCTELVTGMSLTGKFTLSSERIEACIYAYDNFFCLDMTKPFFLLTETNEIVSLHDNLHSTPSRSSRNIPPVRNVYRQEVSSNIAVIGHDVWASEDKIKRVTFTLKHTKRLLTHGEKSRGLERLASIAKDAFLIFRVQAGGLSLEAYYAATYNIEFQAPTKVWPRYAIEFDDPQSVHDYIQHVSDYVRFLSFCLGVSLTPSEFRIDRLSSAEASAAVEREEYPGDHQVFYLWPETEIDSRDLWIGGSPFRVWNDNDLTAFCAGLIAWMDRASKWRKAYALMAICFEKKYEMNVDRLMNACRWFEEMPLAKPQQAISDRAIDAISEAACAAAEAEGVTANLEGRIRGVIKSIKTETRAELFSRLVKTIQKKFGSDCLPDAAVRHLKYAFKIRNIGAHAFYAPPSEAAFQAFSKSIWALEALCLLLTAYDLPIETDGLGRMRNNPVIRDYHQSYDV